MKNNDIYILHLSDLHIRNENKSNSPEVFYSFALQRLIDDVAHQIQFKEKVIIVISGDIVDQGNYVAHRTAAIKFFSDFYKKTEGKVSDIIVVPGNHDKCRDPVNSLISIAHAKIGIESDTNESHIEWNKQLEAYNSFLRLIKEIYKIFGLDKEFENTFGIDVINIDNFNICFLRLDSAWCSHSENDYRMLRISKHQLNSLCNEYKSICHKYKEIDNPIGLTIAVYPLNWLTVEDEELCNSFFLSDEHLDVDILMCGHVHDFSVVNSFNHSHSLLTLVTGIGWGVQEPSSAERHHRYSLYSLNPFYNSCDIVMRKTKANGNFDFDYSIYVGEHEVKDNKLRYPLKVKESNAFIRLNAAEDIDAKSLFVDNSLIEEIPIVSEAMISFSESLTRLYGRYKDNFWAGIMEEHSFPKESSIPDQIRGYLYEDEMLSTDIKNKYLKTKSVFQDFLAFLREICVCAVEELQVCFSSSSFLRAHFRWHDCFVEKQKIQKDEYPMLCQASNLPDNEKSDSMQIVHWGGLIEPTFKTGSPMVFSANRKNNSIDTVWDDFITIIPRFNDYSHDIRIKRGKNVSRPILTFGFSLKEVQSKCDSVALYLLAYLGFDKILTKMIDEYIRLFNIDVKNFLPTIQAIKNTTRREEHNNG